MSICSIYNHTEEFIRRLSRPTQRFRHADSRQRRQTSGTPALVSYNVYDFGLRFSYSSFNYNTVRLKHVPCIEFMILQFEAVFVIIFCKESDQLIVPPRKLSMFDLFTFTHYTRLKYLLHWPENPA